MIRALFALILQKNKSPNTSYRKCRLYKCNLNDTKMKLLSVPEGVNL